MRASFAIIGLIAATSLSAHARLQVPSASAATSNNSALTDPTFRPDVQILIDADKQFAADVAKGGGAAFASWFADDAVSFNNKSPIVQGKSAIAAHTKWKPEDYQLTWTPEGGRIGRHGEMGITWGHYQGRGKDNQGNLQVTSGRYLTVWEKDATGTWKVLVDASNEGPPESDSCCSIH